MVVELEVFDVFVDVELLETVVVLFFDSVEVELLLIDAVLEVAVDVAVVVCPDGTSIAS